MTASNRPDPRAATGPELRDAARLPHRIRPAGHPPVQARGLERLQDAPVPVTPAGKLSGQVGTSAFPAPTVLADFLPDGAFRGGSTVEVLESTSLLVAVIASATSTGAWAAAVGMPELGMLAAADHGIDLARLGLVPQPGPDWLKVVAALVDGVAVVAVRPPSPVTAADKSRLTARLRQRGGLLITTCAWDGADVSLRVSDQRWYGLGQGRGRFKARTAMITVHGRGALVRTRQTTVWLPAPDGQPIAAYDAIPAGSLADPPATATVA
ncbi:hypothetical protein WEI85_45950 [Actinomycetes bacterium KLBMP 9797]